MKKIIVLLAVISLVAVTSMFALADNGPAEIKLEASMGAVTFQHAAHQGRVADCATCHHKGLETPKCTACHGVDAAAPDAKKAFHDSCKECHKKMSGPTKCKECHIK
jgi:cytochrome c553